MTVPAFDQLRPIAARPDGAAPSPVKLLAFGEPGAGKTALLASAPGVLHLLFEAHGLATVEWRAPKALRVLVPEEAARLGCSPVDVLRSAVIAAQSGRLPSGVRTLAIDGLTEVQQAMKAEVLASRGESGAEDARPTTEEYGQIKARMRRLLRTLRDLPCHVACTALAETVVDEEEGSRHLRPLFEGGIGAEVPAYFNVVGYCFKRVATAEDAAAGHEVAGEVAYRVMLDGPSRYGCKRLQPLGRIERPDLAGWVARTEAARSPAGAAPRPADAPATKRSEPGPEEVERRLAAPASRPGANQTAGSDGTGRRPRSASARAALAAAATGR